MEKISLEKLPGPLGNYLGVSPGLGERGVLFFARTSYSEFKLPRKEYTQEGDLNLVKGNRKGGQKRRRKSAVSIRKIPPSTAGPGSATQSPRLSSLLSRLLPRFS